MWPAACREHLKNQDRNSACVIVKEESNKVAQHGRSDARNVAVDGSDDAKRVGKGAIFPTTWKPIQAPVRWFAVFGFAHDFIFTLFQQSSAPKKTAHRILCTFCFPLVFIGAKQTPTPLLPEPTRRAASIQAMQTRVSLDEGGRGIRPLVVQGDLERASLCLAELPADTTVVILTGFPCCVEHSPPTETDGPSGALVIARACLSRGLRVLMLTDDCNGEVIQAGIHTLQRQLRRRSSEPFAHDCQGGDDRLQLEVFPPKGKWDERQLDRMRVIARERCHHIISIERTGPAADGRSTRAHMQRGCSAIASVFFFFFSLFWVFWNTKPPFPSPYHYLAPLLMQVDITP